MTENIKYKTIFRGNYEGGISTCYYHIFKSRYDDNHDTWCNIISERLNQ